MGLVSIDKFFQGRLELFSPAFCTPKSQSNTAWQNLAERFSSAALQI